MCISKNRIFKGKNPNGGAYLSKFEDSKSAVKNSDFTDFKAFVKSYLNTAEPKQRKKLADEFKKRHLELSDFIKDNSDLITAEIEISKTIQAAVSGVKADNDNKTKNSLADIIIAAYQHRKENGDA